MFRCNHHHQGARYLSLPKLYLLKQSIKIVNEHIVVVNLVAWLHILSILPWKKDRVLFY